MIVESAHAIGAQTLGTMPPDARGPFDLLALAAAIATTAGDALPHLIQILAGALVIIRLWETATVQAWVSAWRKRGQGQ